MFVVSLRRSCCWFGDPASGVVHRVDKFNDIVLGLIEDPASFFSVVSVGRHTSGFVMSVPCADSISSACTMPLATASRRDAAEDVDEDRLDLGSPKMISGRPP